MIPQPVDPADAAKVLTIDPEADLRSPEVRAAALDAIEGGGVVYLPGRGFELTPRESAMISDVPAMLANYREPKKASGRPTIIYDPARERLNWHFSRVQGRFVRARVRPSERVYVQAMMARFVEWSERMIADLVPRYASALLRDRVTYRPYDRNALQALHADATYGFPTEGRGMLRLFCNVNPAKRPRTWQVGEPFETLAGRLVPKIPVREPRRIFALAARMGMMDGRPTAYDQLMIDLKRATRDKQYQRTAPREVLEFPAGSCWLALTDLVLHGAVSGQHSIDRTWFLPPDAMRDPSRSSLRILERLSGRPLV